MRAPTQKLRDSAIAYGILAVVIVAFGVLTGGEVVRSVLIALAFFALATAYTWWRFRRRRDRET